VALLRTRRDDKEARRDLGRANWSDRADTESRLYEPDAMIKQCLDSACGQLTAQPLSDSGIRARGSTERRRAIDLAAGLRILVDQYYAQARLRSLDRCADSRGASANDR
jgi:hypothetical protein